MKKLLILPVFALGIASLSFSASAGIVSGATNIVESAGNYTVGAAKWTGHAIGHVFKGGVDLTTGAVHKISKI